MAQTTRDYEAIFILSSSLNEQAVTDMETELKGLVEKANGQVLEADKIGKRRLAFPIAKETDGVYLDWKVQLPTDQVASFNRSVRLLDGVLRLMLTEGTAAFEWQTLPTRSSRPVSTSAPAPAATETPAPAATETPAPAAAETEATAAVAETPEAKPEEASAEQPAESEEKTA